MKKLKEDASTIKSHQRIFRVGGVAFEKSDFISGGDGDINYVSESEIDITVSAADEIGYLGGYATNSKYSLMAFYG